jgi:serine O-acetyltransferase
VGRQGEQPGLAALVQEDWNAHKPRPLAKPGFHALALYRFGYWQQRLPPPLRKAARVAHDAAYFVTRVVYGIELPRTTQVGRRLVIGHQGGIVISGECSIGDDCLIRQNVTIGANMRGGPVPTIGSRVEIGAGAVIAGDVTVGDDVVIGPNAVVTSDVPPGSRVVAPPARILPPGWPAGAPAEGRQPSAEGPQPSTDAHPPPDVERVAALIRERLELDRAIDESTPLISSGLVDSLNVVVLLEALEEEYGVVLASEEIDAERFDTVAQIVDFVRARQ